MKRYGSLRWILLAAGVIAILGLTSMNVYSLYELHESTIQVDRQPKKLQVAEFSDRVRYRFFKPFWGLSSTSMERLKSQFQQNNQFTKPIKKRIAQAATDSIFNDIYFIPASLKNCGEGRSILKYHKERDELLWEDDYPAIVCDGMGTARTQVKALVQDHKYNNKVIFDTNQSITIVFIDPSEHTIFGYLTMPLNQDYLQNHFLPSELVKRFGDPGESGMNVWLRDWTNNRIIASSNPDVPYDRDKIQFKQRFPDFFDNWKLEVSFTNTPTIEASNSSLFKNLVVLGAAVLLLLGSLVFMFISAQKERALAERQAGFLANVTHELKTPLAVMQAAGENLSDGRVKDQSRLKNYGTHIYNEAVRLRKMIEKLLDVAKADAGQSLIEPKPVHLGQLVHNYIDEQEPIIKGRDFTLETAIADDVPVAMVDTDSFDTIISNLVENAMKYSNGEQYLGIFLEADEEHISLKVEDHGIGMSKKVKSQIFDKFYRGEDTLTAQTKGHGLGLSIVKNLVELNGGTISVDSTVGEGSVFEVTFPVLVKVPPGKESSSGAPPSLTKESEKYAS
ncbi:sensor histidine kinase [Fodinibius sediminis]|uniref:histidine kinase n=1 Tax=Fodinibius sediminis TaxID=1214077 RepID=A0A521DZ50_9BACT|nr:HAMP domain-containing sensor histidine kinase [Fodinibius sediminis]SMO76150.1 His Kinase A (phospho-acceptor) domain-containing protein [Fodinibius sediminis]